jgi:uncharacterized protein YjbJ (UPF0337 family)
MARSLRADGRELKGKTRKDAGQATGDNRLRPRGSSKADLVVLLQAGRR